MSLARTLAAGALGAALLLGTTAAPAATKSHAKAAAEAAPATVAATPPAAAPADTPPPQKPPLGESVAAVVNDEVISSYDLRERLLLLVITTGAQPTEDNLAQLKREALRGLIDERLELQEVRSIEKKQKGLKLLPTDKEIDGQIDELGRQNNITRAQFLQTLKSAGVDPQTLRDQFAAQLAWRHYVSGRFGSTVRIGDDQIASALQRQNATAEKPQYLVSEILIDAAKVGGDKAAMEGATQLEAQLKQGAPFGAVARQFSALPTAANGGDAGWLIGGQIPAAIEPVLEAMRPGQLSPPIPVDNGVYIIQLRDKRAGAGATLVSLKQAAVRLPANATPEQVSAGEAKLATVRASYDGCSHLEQEAAKVDGVVAGDLGETEISELSPSFRDVVQTLKVGEIGGPVHTNAGLHLVALCGRRASGAKATPRDEIENQLYGEQLTMIARRYLRDLRNSATIESR